MAGKALAAVMVQPNVLELRDIDIPAIGDDEALVRLAACGICGTDYEWFRGDLRLVYPVILGHEPVGGMFDPLGTGVAWAVDAAGLQPGDASAIWGPYQRGLCAVIGAREAGASQVIITGLHRDAHKLALARGLGADVTIHGDAQDPVKRVEDAEQARKTLSGEASEAAIHVAMVPRPRT